ncbi:helix-turn-helix domain-containing protein [Streptomyces sp. MAA16]|uniref:AraC-like ligand-binding domain-containing protein n=1 Tax=Streptomyces TaxID=1883 RepID=UPI0024755C20|nr:helix-turn-helix domain-containing protein [Streptomyces sp. MAA16]MDH6695880.1 AraC-like DNA-binding protein [Streptomyces sp. MAA16]
MPVVRSTAALVPAERHAYWHDVVSNTFIPLDVALHEREPAEGVIASRRVGFLQIAEVGAGPQTVTRRRRDIARDGEEWLTLTVQQRGRALLEQDGRNVVVGPGEFALSDSGRVFRKVLPEDFSFLAFHLPRARLPLPERELRELVATVFPAEHGVAALVFGYLTRLARQADELDDDTARPLADVAVDLLAVLAREHAGRSGCEAPESPHAVLALAQEYILGHLHDPRLSPESIAAAQRVSVRYLHKVFEREGTTVGRWILRQRLERCRRDLTREPAARTVAAVARRWGFVSPSHFSRAFRTAYGMAPREWRATRADA